MTKAKKNTQLEIEKNDQQAWESDKPLPLTIKTLNGENSMTYPGEVVDNMRYLVTRIGNKEALPGCIAMISALREEGVTYLSLALGATIANDKVANVCVVDLNWWWPSKSPLISTDNPGLAAVIAGKADLNEVITATSLPLLSLVPAGSLPREDRPIVARGQLIKDLLQELRQRFDYLILDVPAILATHDSVQLASLGDACCLIIRQRATHLEDVKTTLDEMAHKKILGVVLNKVRYSTPQKFIRAITAR